MNARTALAAALLVASLAIGASATAPARAQSMACAGGYHPDALGNCQPNIPQVDRYCPQAGTIYQPSPWGWSCVPISKGY